MADLSDTISQNAQQPAETQVDSVRVRQHSLKDQIAADRYLAGKEAVQSAGLGVVLKKLVPPGAE